MQHHDGLQQPSGDEVKLVLTCGVLGGNIWMRVAQDSGAAQVRRRDEELEAGRTKSILIAPGKCKNIGIPPDLLPSNLPRLLFLSLS